jgi:hypothetical protein
MLLVTLATIFTTAATLPAISDASRTSCRSPGSRTVVSSAHGRVFSKLVRHDRFHRPQTTYYGCLYSVGRGYRLGILARDGHAYSMSPMRLRGRFVGFAYKYAGPTDDFYAAVRVVDLRTGRLAHNIFSPGGEDAYSPDVSDLVLRPNGNVAWIVTPRRRDVQPTYSVYKSDPSDSRRQRELDSGNIDPLSLTLAGSSIRWVKDGLPRSATLD